MKDVLLFHFEACPYCQQARRWMDELQREYPELRAVAPTLIDEKRQPELANQYDYWYVPTFYVGGVKAHEGACSREIVERVLRSALE